MDLDRETQINRIMDALADLDDVGPEWYVRYDELRARAEAALAAQARGERTERTWLVVPAQNALSYTAVSPREGIRGCPHTTTTPLGPISRAEAVAEHRRNCLGF